MGRPRKVLSVTEVGAFYRMDRCETKVFICTRTSGKDKKANQLVYYHFNGVHLRKIILTATNMLSSTCSIHGLHVPAFRFSSFLLPSTGPEYASKNHYCRCLCYTDARLLHVNKEERPLLWTMNLEFSGCQAEFSNIVFSTGLCGCSYSYESCIKYFFSFIVNFVIINLTLKEIPYTYAFYRNSMQVALASISLCGFIGSLQFVYS